jgi:hypothetical protein
VAAERGADRGAGFGYYARETADDAEGEAEAFFYYCGLDQNVSFWFRESIHR